MLILNQKCGKHPQLVFGVFFKMLIKEKKKKINKCSHNLYY